MLWEVEIEGKLRDPERERVIAEYELLTHTSGAAILERTSRGYLLDGALDRAMAQRLVDELLVDQLVETGRLASLADNHGPRPGMLTVLLKPGVMDPVAQSIVDAAGDLGIKLDSVRTFRRFYLACEKGTRTFNYAPMVGKILANDAIEQLVEGQLSLAHLTLGQVYTFRRIVVALREADDEALLKISRQGQLALGPEEMKAIQAHFRDQDRDPVDVELETIAQTWSEHCSHKTLKGGIDFRLTNPDQAQQSKIENRTYTNLLKETIFAATQEIRRRLGKDDWCVSVFEDNAGVVNFDDRFHVCFKVETHNHPSAIEPYGGANTGLGGVIRDPLGTGLGARPICNTDVFCFAPPDTLPESLPAGVLHPRRLMQGVVAGVRDYGNRMGIPTVNGAVCFDVRYLANPLVFCGTVGLIPVDRCDKEPRAGDLIVAVGGRTGRDGIHGATFSSLELSAESDKVSGGAVQIGNAITEKKLLDVLLEARDRGLYSAITDCGAGGFSSAIGEMAANIGATVYLDKAPLKYTGLSYTEIWISEAQERMVLAVPPGKWRALESLCSSEGVEATVLGAFEPTGRLRLFYAGEQVADLDLRFLHEGRPYQVRSARFDVRGATCEVRSAKSDVVNTAADIEHRTSNIEHTFTSDLLKILSTYNVSSKEWIVRCYDHEVQGGTVIKPLVGVREDGPGDAAVITPVLGSWAGIAVGCGINPRYGDLDPYWMAAACIDEAARNVVAVGSDPSRIALLDNFCWGNTQRPEVLGSLVRAAEACRDVALAYEMPFISGKDSLNNEYRSGEWHISIPPTVLISALGRVPDVRKCVTMDLKEPGNVLYLIGTTRNELGGSHLHLVRGLKGGAVPRVDLSWGRGIFDGIFRAMQEGLLRSCHDLSEGGLAVALAEMVFAGEVGADVTSLHGRGVKERDEIVLFSESPTRFVVEVEPAKAAAFEACWPERAWFQQLGQTVKEPRLRVAGQGGEWIVWATAKEMKEAWQSAMLPRSANRINW
jgi:phosphoribosylformylglycinamidine synthase subunit PurSL